MKKGNSGYSMIASQNAFTSQGTINEARLREKILELVRESNRYAMEDIIDSLPSDRELTRINPNHPEAIRDSPGYCAGANNHSNRGPSLAGPGRRAFSGSLSVQ